MTRMISLAALLTLAACGASAQKACDNVASCYEGDDTTGTTTDDAGDVCVEQYEALEADSADAGCDAEYKDFVKCMSSVDCDSVLDGSACADEFDAWGTCIAGGGTTETTTAE